MPHVTMRCVARVLGGGVPTIMTHFLVSMLIASIHHHPFHVHEISICMATFVRPHSLKLYVLSSKNRQFEFVFVKRKKLKMREFILDAIKLFNTKRPSTECLASLFEDHSCRIDVLTVKLLEWTF